ncbi:choice-of-anchor A family protein [Agromyces sp. NPDC060279]|uniref:DUF7927 domain-containing protein n=1 Tax=Agromyces sp. NPDC060279 TaxID=3347092 RepID=UPI003656FC5F
MIDNNVSLYTGGDLILAGGVAEVEGLVVVGRDARVQPSPARRIDLGVVGVGSGVIPGGGGPALAVGRDLTVSRGSTLAVGGGPVQVGGRMNPGYPDRAYAFSSGGRDGLGATAVADWAAFGERLRSTSAEYAALRPTGSISWGENFEGTGAAREVFSVSAADLPNEIDFSGIAEDATVIVNVRGARVDWAPTWISEDGRRVDVPDGTVNGFGRTAQRTIWNFVDATSVTLGGSSQILGSILVPGAAADPGRPTVDVTANTNGRLLSNGSIRLAGTSNEHHNYPFREKPFACDPDPEKPVDPPTDPEVPVDPPEEGVLEVEKTVSRAHGTVVAPGQRVDYAVTFRNVGDGPVDVEHVDALDDVLDDAGLDPGSLTAEEPLSAVLDGQRIHVAGTLPAGAQAAVRYRVTVNAADRLGNRMLRNLVFASDTEPPGCDDALACTENPVEVPAWTVAKHANPASGSEILPGDTVAYTVTATGLVGTVPDASITDELGDVLGAADFVAGSATLAVGDAPATPVPDPVAGRLDSGAFALTAGQEARLSYRVVVHDDAWAGTLRNLAWGSGSVDPDDCTADAPCATEHHTPVRGPQLPQTGGGGTAWMTASGLVVLGLTATALLVRRRRTGTSN